MYVPAVTKAYTYDDAGNLIGKTTGGDYGAKAESYVYDAFGRMTEYKVGGETVATYGYNGNGERVSKTVDGSLTKFYLENGNVLNEGNGTALNVTNYFGATGIFKRASGETESILYKNGHGDVTRKTSGTSVIRDYDYDAYGKEKTATEDDNPFRYAGEYADQETGLIYLRARHYDSSIGRFTAEDPIKDGLNWYVYCSNNPINRVDPWGLYEIEQANGKTYAVIEAGDTLYGIAQGVTGDGNRWKEIGYDGEPTGLQIGQKVDVTNIYTNSYTDICNESYSSNETITAKTKTKPKFEPRKDPRKGSEDRKPTGDRERNVGHPNGEEHSRVPKGTPGVRKIETVDTVGIALGGTAILTTIYWIISEGSRIVVPVRNLIPIP